MSYNIVISGPESTGKSTIAEYLAHHYNAAFIPEYARLYIESLGRPYDFNDIEHIARKQASDLVSCELLPNHLLFIDTYLIITKVWFDVVYGKVPIWIDENLRNAPIRLYLLCNTDIEWVADSVRENGGIMRNTLFDRYLTEIEYYNFPYKIISGTGQQRLNCAISAVDDFLKRYHNDK